MTILGWLLGESPKQPSQSAPPPANTPPTATPLPAPVPTPTPVAPAEQVHALQSAAEGLVRSENDAQANLSQKPKDPEKPLSCESKQTGVPCDIKSYKVVEIRTVPNYLNERLKGGSRERVVGADEAEITDKTAPTQDTAPAVPTPEKPADDPDDVKRKYPKEFVFDPKGTHQGEKYNSESCIEFIGGDPVTGSTTTVTVTFEEDFVCPVHSHMVITDPFGKTTHSKLTSKPLQLKYPSKWLPIRETAPTEEAPKGGYWVWGFTPATWIVTAEVCGFRRAGEQTYGPMTARLVVWPPDEFELEFNVPPSFKKTGNSETTDRYLNGAHLHVESRSSQVERRSGLVGQNLESTSSGTRASYAERDGVRTPQYVTNTTGEKVAYGQQSISVLNSETTRGGNLVGMTEQVTTVTGSLLGTRTTNTQDASVGQDGDKTTNHNDYSGLTFYIKRSGRLLTSNYSRLRTIIEVITKIESAVEAIRAFIRALGAIQVGVTKKMEWEYEFFSGKITAKWGWREWSDHRCYVAYSATFAIKLFSGSIDFSIGLGLKVSQYELSANVGAKGSFEARLEGTMKRKGPDGVRDVTDDAKLIGEPSFEVYVVAIAGSEDFASARGSITAKLTIDATPKFEQEGFLVNCSCKVEKTVALLDCHAAWVFKFRRHREILPEKSLFKDHKVHLT